MTPWSLVLFAAAMFVLAITPGPGVFATVARALASGLRHAAAVVAGIVIGDLLFLVAAVYGLAALAQVLGDLFAFVKYAGAAYLIWLGVGLWRAPPGKHAIRGVKELSWHSSLVTGLVITLGNPKVILFYLGFLPTFVDLEQLSPHGVMLIAAVVAVVVGGVLLGYACGAARARRWFRSARAERVLNRGAGGIMIATGAVLASRN